MDEPKEIVLPSQEALAAVVQGDVSKLSQKERSDYLVALSESLGLNPLLKPLEFIKLKDGRVVLYATKNCAAQLRQARKIKVEITYQGALHLHDDVYDNSIYIVEAKATMGDLVASDVGTAWVKNIVGDDLANAIMKAWTKAQRRVTLAITGIALPDESETDTMPIDRTPQLTTGPTRLVPNSREKEAAIDAELIKRK